MQGILREVLQNSVKPEGAQKRPSPFNQPEIKRQPFEDFKPHPSQQVSNLKDESIASFLRNSLPKIQVVGIGGAGNNAVNRLSEIGLEGVEIIAVNTDAMDLLKTNAPKKILIGKEITKGFGAGNNPSLGESAAKESINELKELINGDLVFITCGLGGGTGTGAAHIIAGIAKENGALAISVSTLPFKIEGKVRMENARKGLRRLYDASDTVIIVPNEKLLRLSENITLLTAFKVADEVLIRAVTAIAELITKPQLINLDFADVRKVLADGGVAMITIGSSTPISGKNASVEEAVNDALRNPLLKDLELSTARKALICVQGGDDLELSCAEKAVRLIANEIENDSEIIWGASINPEFNGMIRIIVILSDVKSPFTEPEGGIFYPPTEIDDIIDQIPSALNPSSFRTESDFSERKKVNIFQQIALEQKNDNSKKKKFFLF